jgi:DNA repair protein RadC
MSIHNLLPDERPRERCLRTGPLSLSLRELVAVILGTGPSGQGCLGVARAIVDAPGAASSPEEQAAAFFTALEGSPSGALNPVRGLGPAGRARILASFELARRYAAFRAGRLRQEAPSVRGTRSSTEHLAILRVSEEDRQSPREWLGFVPVFGIGRVGPLCRVETGARTHVNVEPAELFSRILALRPNGIVLFHNHPSGSLEPSWNDLELTRSVQNVASALGIRLLGHWILTAVGERRIDL